jgi:hypothetical protein
MLMVVGTSTVLSKQGAFQQILALKTDSLFDYLLFNLVGATEHVVDAGEKVGARVKVLSAALWSIVLLQVSLFTQVAHLRKISTCFHRRIFDTYIIVHLWLDYSSAV